MDDMHKKGKSPQGIMRKLKGDRARRGDDVPRSTAAFSLGRRIGAMRQKADAKMRNILQRAFQYATKRHQVNSTCMSPHIFLQIYV